MNFQFHTFYEPFKCNHTFCKMKTKLTTLILFLGIYLKFFLVNASDPKIDPIEAFPFEIIRKSVFVDLPINLLGKGNGNGVLVLYLNKDGKIIYFKILKLNIKILKKILLISTRMIQYLYIHQR